LPASRHVTSGATKTIFGHFSEKPCLFRFPRPFPLLGPQTDAGTIFQLKFLDQLVSGIIEC
jgi:hypothetical protein